MNGTKPGRRPNTRLARLESRLSEPAFEGSGDPEARGAGVPGATPHLVIKRGHRGRYRFAFFHHGNRLAGDVRIADLGADRAAQEADARAAIRKIVAAFLAALE